MLTNPLDRDWLHRFVVWVVPLNDVRALPRGKTLTVDASSSGLRASPLQSRL